MIFALSFCFRNVCASACVNQHVCALVWRVCVCVPQVCAALPPFVNLQVRSRRSLRCRRASHYIITSSYHYISIYTDHHIQHRYIMIALVPSLSNRLDLLFQGHRFDASSSSSGSTTPNCMSFIYWNHNAECKCI